MFALHICTGIVGIVGILGIVGFKRTYASGGGCLGVCIETSMSVLAK